jgi:peptide deformylase
MLDTMYLAPGIGLAAPQVGVTKRILVVDVAPKDAPREPIRMANPEIVWRSDELAVYEEGCLSLPEQYADVERPAKIRVRYLDEKGETQEREADGLLATCIQHEMDHLDGVIFVDHLSALKRKMILRKLTKQKKLEALAGD